MRLVITYNSNCRERIKPGTMNQNTGPNFVSKFCVSSAIKSLETKRNETKNIDNKLACIELKFGLIVDYGLFLENLMYTVMFLHLP